MHCKHMLTSQDSPQIFLISIYYTIIWCALVLYLMLLGLFLWHPKFLFERSHERNVEVKKPVIKP